MISKMGKIAWVSAFVTLFSYYQNMGVIASTISAAPTPPKLVLVMDVTNRFVRTLCGLIEAIPKFDIRLELVIMSVIIPVILDIILIWFLCPKLRMFVHFIDTILVGVWAYTVAYMFYGAASITIIAIFSAISIVLVLRYGIELYKKQTGTKKRIPPVKTLAKDMSDCMMYNVLTNAEWSYSLDSLNAALASFSDVMHILPSNPTPYITVLLLILAIIMLFAAVWCVLPIPFLPEMPVIVSIWYPIIGFPVGLVIFVIAIMRFSVGGRKMITHGKMILRRYGTKILLTVLHLLYLPVVTVLMDLSIPKLQACNDGFYTHWALDDGSILQPFLNRSYECMPCTISSDLCNEMCYNAHDLRLRKQPGLSFLNDVMGPCSVLFVYALGAVVIGVPVLFSKIISDNREIVSNIVAFGSTVDDKWDRLMDRIESTGISLFSDFEWKWSKWTLIQLLCKVSILLFSVLYEVVSPYAILAFPVYYFILTIALGVCSPYRMTFNNVLETWTFFCLCLFSCVQIAILGGYLDISSWEVAFPIIFYCLPFASFFCLLGGNSHQIVDDDPTLVTREDHDAYKHKHTNQSSENYKGISVKQTTNRNFVDDIITISYASVQSVSEQSFYDCESNRVVNGEPVQFSEYQVSKSRFAKRIMKIYVLIDVIIDGLTTNLITRCLSIGVTCGMIGVGFYIGATTRQALPETFVC